MCRQRRKDESRGNHEQYIYIILGLIASEKSRGRVYPTRLRMAGRVRKQVSRSRLRQRYFLSLIR